MRHSIAALIATSLLGIALNGFAWTVRVSCDVRDVPPNYAFPLCQDAPTVYEGQMVALKGASLDPGLPLAAMYLKTVEFDPKTRGYVERRIQIALRNSYRDANGKLWNDPVVGPDGTFNIFAYIPETSRLAPNLPQEREQALFIDLVGELPVLNGVPGGTNRIVEIAATINLKRGPPQKIIRQEVFECDGPDPQRRRIEQNPAAPDPERIVRCYAEREFTFVGGPYHQLDPGGGGYGIGRLVLRPRGDASVLNWKDMRNLGSNVPNPLPDQILHFEKGKWQLPSADQLARQGVWQLTVVGRNNVTRDIGLIEIVAPPKIVPPPIVKQKYRFSAVRRGDTQHFLRPDPERFYQGGTIKATLPAAAFTCDKSGRENWCVSSQNLTRDPLLVNRYCAAYLGSTQLEGHVTFADLVNPAHVLSVKLPDGLAPGAYRLLLSCPEVRDSRYIGEIGWNPFDADGATTVRIEAQRPAPKVTVVPQVAPPGGTSVYETRRRMTSCAPCNGENYSIDLSGLVAGDNVALIQWSSAESWPASTATVLQNMPAGRSLFSAPARIPDKADSRPYEMHKLTVKLKNSFGQEYDVPPADMTSNPKGAFPNNGEWSFYKSCVGLDAVRPAKIDKITNPVDLLASSRADVRLSNFDCGASLTVRQEIPALGIDQKFGFGYTGTTETSDIQIEFTYPESAWLDRVTVPTEAKLTFTTPDTGRSATVTTTLLPRRRITVLTRPLVTGQRIEVEWKGFKSNLGADLLFDGDALNGRPLLLDGTEPTVTARLPEGITGRHKLTLTDSAGTTASTDIEIPGEPNNIDRPKTPDTLCDRPCVLVPATAGQGDLVAVRFSAFPHNAPVKFTLNGNWLIKQGQYQSGLVDSIDYKIPEGLPDGDYDIVGENGDGGDRVAAKGTIRISGKYQAPTLEAVKVSLPDNKHGWYRLGIDKIHVKGMRWTLGGGFTANLLGIDQNGRADRTRIYAVAPPPLDGCLSSSNGMFGNACDLRGGEINQFWQLDPNVQPGRYTLELSDGLSNELTQGFDVLPTKDEAVSQPDPKQPDPKGQLDRTELLAGETVIFSGENFAPGTQIQALLDGQAFAAGQASARADAAGRVRALPITIPATVQPGSHQITINAPATRTGISAASQGGAQAPIGLGYQITIRPRPVEPKPELKPQPVQQTDAKPCDPELPKFWQLGCIEGVTAPKPVTRPQPKPEPPPEPQPAQRKPCDPRIPSYSQPKCIP